MSSREYALLANTVLLAHFAFVLFIVAGLALIWIGRVCGWGWVRNLWFRVAHLAVMGIVAVQAILGRFCPLTLWEDALRRDAGEPGHYGSEGCIVFWVHRVMFYDFPAWVFTTAYVSVFLLIVITWFAVRPRRFFQCLEKRA